MGIRPLLPKQAVFPLPQALSPAGFPDESIYFITILFICKSNLLTIPHPAKGRPPSRRCPQGAGGPASRRTGAGVRSDVESLPAPLSRSHKAWYCWFFHPCAHRSWRWVFCRDRQAPSAALSTYQGHSPCTLALPRVAECGGGTPYHLWVAGRCTAHTHTAPYASPQSTKAPRGTAPSPAGGYATKIDTLCKI